MEDIAASGDLFPLASGVDEAICVFRLEGIPELFATVTACVGEGFCAGGTLERGGCGSTDCACVSTGGNALGCAAVVATSGAGVFAYLSTTVGVGASFAGLSSL
jgi:hypothetical protein